MTISKKTITNAITKFKEYNFLHKDDIVTSWSSTVSNSKYPTEKLVKDTLDTKENTSNKTTTLTSSSTDIQYPSAKSVYDAIQEISPSGEVELEYYWDNTNKQLVLEYDNITQINGGGSNVEIVTSWEQTPSDEKVPSEKLTKDTLDTKISKSSTTGLVKNDGTVDTNNYSLTSHNHAGTYANASHNHSYTNLNNVTTVEVTVTYTDNSTETIKLLKYTGT